MTKVLTISKRLCYTLPPNRRLQEYAVMGEKDDTLLNSRQVAELLDLSPDTINELARKHSLPGMKRGRQWRFRCRDVDFFKSQRREQAAA